MKATTLDPLGGKEIALMAPCQSVTGYRLPKHVTPVSRGSVWLRAVLERSYELSVADTPCTRGMRRLVRRFWMRR